MDLVYSTEDALQAALHYADNGFLCSEAVLLSLSEAVGVKSKLIPRIATGFGAGIARSGNICGALSGAIMGLGVSFGRDEVSSATVSKYWFSNEFVESFKKEFGTLRCPVLLGLDLDDPEDYEIFRKKNLWEKKCKPIIKKSVELAYKILERNIEKE